MSTCTTRALIACPTCHGGKGQYIAIALVNPSESSYAWESCDTCGGRGHIVAKLVPEPMPEEPTPQVLHPYYDYPDPMLR